jgi:uncharacterized protein YbjT (DUF2867 family)
MTTILVTGATSGPGGPLVEKLRSAGHEVRAMSRTAGDGRVVADLSTGEGLDAALAGAEVVVHLATNRKKDLPDTERLLAAARAADVRHVVFLSIVGVDRIPYFYYRDKVAIEQAIEASGLPYTILGGRLFVKDVKVQPIGVIDTATRLAELAAGTPAGRVADIGGPEILEASDILARLQAAGRANKRVLSLALPGQTFDGFQAGHHLAGLPGYGTQTFDEWLASGASK